MVSPAIHFPGTCLEAMNLYEVVFNGTDKQIDFYRDAPKDPGFKITFDMEDFVMHASMKIQGTQFNFSDNLEELDAGDRICFNMFMDNQEAVVQAFEKLKVDGEILVDIGPQFFSKMYASVIDKFGIKWQLIS